MYKHNPTWPTAKGSSPKHICMFVTSSTLVDLHGDADNTESQNRCMPCVRKDDSTCSVGVSLPAAVPGRILVQGASIPSAASQSLIEAACHPWIISGRCPQAIRNSQKPVTNYSFLLRRFHMLSWWINPASCSCPSRPRLCLAKLQE